MRLLAPLGDVLQNICFDVSDCSCPYMFSQPRELHDITANISAKGCGPMDCIFILSREVLHDEMDLFLYVLHKLTIHDHEEGDFLKLYLGKFSPENRPPLLKTSDISSIL